MNDIYRQAARLRTLALAVRMPDDESQALRDIADALDAIGDAWAADETEYARVLDVANFELARLRERPCPYMVTSGEGTSYCTLAEQQSTRAVRGC